jgi:hypothetical protein
MRQGDSPAPYARAAPVHEPTATCFTLMLLTSRWPLERRKRRDSFLAARRGPHPTFAQLRVRRFLLRAGRLVRRLFAFERLPDRVKHTGIRDHAEPRFASWSQAALSLGLREFSAMRSHSSALVRYSSGLFIVPVPSQSLSIEALRSDRTPPSAGA